MEEATTKFQPQMLNRGYELSVFYPCFSKNIVFKFILNLRTEGKSASFFGLIAAKLILID